MDKQELEKLSVKELRVKLVEGGMPKESAELFTTKAQIIATLLTSTPKEREDVGEESGVSLQEVSDAKESEKAKVSSINEKPNPAEDRLINREWKTKAEIMKHKLLSMEHVSIIVPLEPKEKVGRVIWVETKTNKYIPDAQWHNLTIEQKMTTHQEAVEGAFVSPQLNGYKYFIPKGIYYRVPLQIAQVITDSQQQTLDAGKDIDINRIDPRTNRPISEVFLKSL